MFVDAIEESPILALIGRIFELRQRGVTILGLHVGEPDFDTPAGVRLAAQQALDRGQTHYAPAQGLVELRSSVAARLTRLHGIDAQPEHVVILPAKFAIYASLLATVAPGDEVLLADPTYLFEQPVRLVGARPVYFPLQPDFSFDVTALQRAITPRSRVVVLATPANPTGRTLSRENVESVLSVAREHDLTVVSDETYDSLVYEGRHVAAASVADGSDRVVTIGSFSKTFAMTGWRAGYAVGPSPLVARIVKVIEHTLTCVPPFIQSACLWALEHAQEDAERFRALFRERRDLLLQQLADIPGLTVIRPEGAFYVFPKYDLSQISVQFADQLLEEERLAVVPGVAFGPAGEYHIRLSYSSPTEALIEGARRLREFMNRHRSG